MTRRDDPRGRLLAAAIVLGILGYGRCSPAQEAEEEREVVAPQPRAVLMSDQQFDRWVFAGAGNADRRRDALDSLLSMRIADVDRACGLTEPQRKKLRLAGRGDIKRFFDRVEDKRREFQVVRNDQRKLNEFLNSLRPMRVAPSTETFGEGSIFSKVLKTALDEDQSAKYEESLREKDRIRYRVAVNQVVTRVGRALRLSAKQRRDFAKVLAEETRLPTKFGPFDYYVVLLQAAKVPEEKIRPLFDEDQWRLLGQHFEQARRMKPLLDENGFTP